MRAKIPLKKIKTENDSKAKSLRTDIHKAEMLDFNGNCIEDDIQTDHFKKRLN